ncbi:MAG: hypothetical protein GKR91_02170 [Pseudomonadales bacterium]|nr:hypothetical protein [Pseudomonadales bacterium]
MTKHKQKTIDGERIAVADLNVEAPFAPNSDKKGLIAKLAAAYKNLSLVMAGMYTGLNCYGTPHSHRDADEDKNKPDRRLI